MNREIEFRARDKNTGRWVYGSYFKHIKRQVAPLGDGLKEEDIEHYIIKNGFADWNMPKHIDFVMVDGETVGEYIGLLDCNKAEIYEGDIVLCKKNIIGMENKKFIGVIEFRNGSFCINRNGLYCYNLLDYRMEVIGNIHDDSELLEEE